MHWTFKKEIDHKGNDIRFVDVGPFSDGTRAMAYAVSRNDYAFEQLVAYLEVQSNNGNACAKQALAEAKEVFRLIDQWRDADEWEFAGGTC